MVKVVDDNAHVYVQFIGTKYKLKVVVLDTTNTIFDKKLSINNDYGFFEVHKPDMWFSQKVIVLSTRSNPLTT
ncbi:hypothetical protein WN944_003918 [Citrus x changshan-huyou]|uniref:Uncharacterized protein n=1 Tax=Citrus x changshan-huyou TaxID=2935761 RepID=A0AAP0M0X7_9ROSI